MLISSYKGCSTPLMILKSQQQQPCVNVKVKYLMALQNGFVADVGPTLKNGSKVILTGAPFKGEQHPNQKHSCD